MYDYNNNELLAKEKESLALKFLYNTIIGRMLLKILTRKWITNLYAKYMNSSLSVRKIKSFIIKNNINMDEYEDCKYKSFNDFFMRKIRDDKRTISDGLISVCDSKLSVYEISKKNTFHIKNSIYSLEDLVMENVDKYNFKYALVFRLCVDDYHHYVFPDSGIVVKNKKIDGVLHTVRPIAFRKNKVFLENSREVTFLKCDNLGDVCFVEVGALFVGKIVNEKVKKFKKGDEKGHFEFGGSTVVMLIQDNVNLNKKLLDNTNNDIETIVKLGNRLDMRK